MMTDDEIIFVEDLQPAVSSDCDRNTEEPQLVTHAETAAAAVMMLRCVEQTSKSELLDVICMRIGHNIASATRTAVLHKK